MTRQYVSSHNRDWEPIRDEYVSTDISLRDLAKKTGIPYPTLRDRSIREAWAEGRKDAKVLCESAVKANVSSDTKPVVQTAVDRARATNALTQLSAAVLIDRTIHESNRWLDRINTTSERKEHENPDAIRKLTGAWKDVISVARLTHGLDSTGTTVNVAVFGKPQAIEAEAIDVQVISPPEHNTE